MIASIFDKNSDLDKKCTQQTNIDEHNSTNDNSTKLVDKLSNDVELYSQFNTNIITKFLKLV
jgi:hypothetical protein